MDKAAMRALWETESERLKQDVGPGLPKVEDGELIPLAPGEDPGEEKWSVDVEDEIFDKANTRKQALDRLEQLKPGEGVTLSLLKRCLPTGRKNLATKGVVDELNAILADYRIRENFRENVLGFMSVLKNPNYRMTDYINAVKYVSYKLLGDSNVVAWSKTFPERYARLTERKADSQAFANLVGAYNRGALVNAVMEQTLVPHYILNQDLYQKALNVQVDLMMHARSEKVRTDAANSVLNQLKMPEVSKLQLDVNVKEDDSISELKRTTAELVAQQKALLRTGVVSAKDMAQQKIHGSVDIEDVDYEIEEAGDVT